MLGQQKHVYFLPFRLLDIHLVCHMESQRAHNTQRIRYVNSVCPPISNLLQLHAASGQFCTLNGPREEGLGRTGVCAELRIFKVEKRDKNDNTLQGMNIAMENPPC